MTEFSRVFILAEDTRHQQFVRRHLYKAGFSYHEIEAEPIPQGRGAGDQWVRERYPHSVKKFRARAAKAKTAPIVVIDSDTGPLSRRESQLKQSLGEHPRRDEEAIVHFIPRRNIETWILHLSGEQVDEGTDYRHKKCDDLIPAAALVFHQWTLQPPPDCLPSITAAIQEAGRLV